MLFKLRSSAERSIAGLEALMLEARKLVDTQQHGFHIRGKTGLGDNFWQFREYDSASDRSQDIDWKQSAKNSHIYVREKEMQSAQDHFIWVDKNAGMRFCSKGAPVSKLERAQTLAMALALMLTRSGETIGLIGTHIRGHSEHTLEDFGLHLLENQGDIPLDIRDRAHVFLIGDFINPIEEIEAQIVRLSKRAARGVCLQILDPAEISLPYHGRVIFEGHMADEPSIELHNVRSVRETYQARIANHFSAIEALCQKYGWYYALHQTDQEARECLMGIMEAQQI